MEEAMRAKMARVDLNIVRKWLKMLRRKNNNGYLKDTKVSVCADEEKGETRENERGRWLIITKHQAGGK